MSESLLSIIERASADSPTRDARGGTSRRERPGSPYTGVIKMEPSEMKALMIRCSAALRLRRVGALDAWEALVYTVAPTPEVLEASMTMALAKKTED